MTGEVKDGSRKRWHQRSKSSIGDFTSQMHLEPKDVLQKVPSTKGKTTGKDHGRSWFKSKKAQPKESDSSEHPEATDPEEEEKPVQRVVQGLYRDDDGGPSPKILVTSHSAAREAIKEFAKDFVAQLKANPDGRAAMETQMRQHLRLATGSPQTDLKFLAQAYITHLFFADFENASFGMSIPGEKPWEVQQHMHSCFEQFQKCKSKTQTVSKVLGNESNESFLSQFCMKKFRTLIPLDAGGAFFGGDCRYYLDLGKGIHTDTPFYRSFLSAAVSIWLLQRLAFSFEQKIVTIYPTIGDVFQRRFMEPVVPGLGDTEDENGDNDLEIVFTVFPGFRVSESIVESLVYIVEKPQVEDPISSSIGNKADEVGQSASKESRYRKLYSFPASTSGKLSEISAIRGPQKFFSLKDTSQSRDGEHGLLQKIRNKLTWKKTPAKGKTSHNSAPTGATEATAALPSLKKAPSLEAPSTDAQQSTPVVKPSVPVESSPFQPLNLEGRTSSYQPAPSTPSGNEGGPLYVLRAQKAAQLQSQMRSPLRSPRLSSVD